MGSGSSSQSQAKYAPDASPDVSPPEAEETTFSRQVSDEAPKRQETCSTEAPTDGGSIPPGTPRKPETDPVAVDEPVSPIIKEDKKERHARRKSAQLAQLEVAESKAKQSAIQDLPKKDEELLAIGNSPQGPKQVTKGNLKETGPTSAELAAINDEDSDGSFGRDEPAPKKMARQVSEQVSPATHKRRASAPAIPERQISEPSPLPKTLQNAGGSIIDPRKPMARIGEEVAPVAASVAPSVAPSRAGSKGFVDTRPIPDAVDARQQRRLSIHAHRMSVDPGCVDLDPTSPGGKSNKSSRSQGSDPASPGGRNRRHSSAGLAQDPGSPTSPGGSRLEKRRCSAMGAESLEILRKQKEERPVWVDEDLCGFKIGDRVSVKDGPDAHGPWEKLGDGTIFEKAPKRGFLRVLFEHSKDVFAIRACNLRNLTDPSRSGAHMLPGKAKIEFVRSKYVEAEADDTPAQNDNLRGMKAGDHVSIGKGGEGVLVKAGHEKGTALVRFGDLGIRCVLVKEITKKKADEDTTREMELMKAMEIDTTTNNQFCVSLHEASGKFDERRMSTDATKLKELRALQAAEAAEEAVITFAEMDPNRGLKAGDYVLVEDENPFWNDVGIGCIRSLGPKVGTMNVQFESGGDTFVMHTTSLRKVKAPEKRFRKTGQQALPESDEGRKHQEKLHKRTKASQEKSSVDMITVK